MTATTREDIKPLNLTPEFRAECSKVEPLDQDAIDRLYAARLAAMTDAEFAVEKARIEATPNGLVHHLVDADADRRALLAAMRPPRCGGWS